eukprot:Rhum_TRINITY_DN244_c0_g1::Rhum_TRINITY_DN244_c0_g1_i1::g.899::m.899/K02737/PSMB5; 20S proteasome subunit beta 5
MALMAMDMFDDVIGCKSFVKAAKADAKPPADEMEDAMDISDIKLSVCPRPSCIPNLKLNKGTTTLAFLYQGGIVCAVDSRASQGSYVASSETMKVLPVNPYIVGTMAGGAADCQYWLNVLWQECRMWELRNKQKVTVQIASKMLADITYQYKRYGLSIGSMVMGWDKFGPSLYMVDDQGTRVKSHLFSVGSGSIYAYGLLDAEYKFDLSTEEALSLGKRAIMHAVHRDAASGGYIQVYHVHAPNEKGECWTRMSREDNVGLIDKAQEDKTMAPIPSTAP